MPFIKPDSRRFFHGKSDKDISVFKDVERCGDFRLQTRKQSLLASVKLPLRGHKVMTCRITHSVAGKQGYCVLALGKDIEKMRKGPWNYIVNNIEYPKNLSDKQKIRWVKGHFTQLAMEEASEAFDDPHPNGRERMGGSGGSFQVHRPTKAVHRGGRKRRGKSNVSSFSRSGRDGKEVFSSSSSALLNSILGPREIFFALLFAAVIAYLRNDVIIFVAAATVVNTFAVVRSQQRSSSDREAFANNGGDDVDALWSPRSDDCHLSPFQQSLAYEGGPKVETERRELIAAAKEIEIAFANDDRGPSGKEARDLAALYQSIAGLTGSGHSSDGFPGSPLCLDDGVAEPEIQVERLNATVGRAKMPRDDAIRPLDPAVLKLRGPTYIQDGPGKGVKFASGPAVYELAGWEAFSVKKKIYHASRFVTLPLPPQYRKELESKRESLSEDDFAEYRKKMLEELKKPVGGLPRYYIVNLQLTAHEPRIYGEEWDGPGYTFLVYFTLSKSTIRQLRRNERDGGGGEDDDVSAKFPSDDLDVSFAPSEVAASKSEEGTSSSSSPLSTKFFKGGNARLYADDEGADEKESSGREHLGDGKEDESADGPDKKGRHDAKSASDKSTTRKPHIHENALNTVRNFVNEDLSLVGDRKKGYLGCMKLCPKCLNVDEIKAVTAVLRKSLSFLNGKPVLTAPQQMFYRGPGYMEHVIDTHCYSYIQRSLICSARSIYNDLRLAIGFTIEGRSLSNLPEQLLCAVELDRLDWDNLGDLDDHYSVPKDRTPGDLHF